MITPTKRKAVDNIISTKILSFIFRSSRARQEKDYIISLSMITEANSFQVREVFGFKPSYNYIGETKYHVYTFSIHNVEFLYYVDALPNLGIGSTLEVVISQEEEDSLWNGGEFNRLDEVMSAIDELVKILMKHKEISQNFKKYLKLHQK